jgi:sugar phosphate isomerase/epimerase
MVGVEAEPLLGYLDPALFFGARLIRILPRTPRSQADLAIVEKSIRSVIDRYRSARAVLALENYEQHTTAQLGKLVERSGDPCVGICLDTVNSLGPLETAQRVVETLGPYVRNLHIKDFTIRGVQSSMGYEVVGCPTGQGNSRSTGFSQNCANTAQNLQRSWSSGHPGPVASRKPS